LIIDRDPVTALDGAMKTLIGLSHSRSSVGRQLVLAGCCAFILFGLAGKAQAGDTQTADEKKIRELEAAFSAAAGTKDIDKVLSYYGEYAVMFVPNAPSATTKVTIRNAWKEMLTPPGASTSWKATKVEVAKSGDLAYTSGPYQDTRNDANGKPIKDFGNYLTVWKKQADGTWKVVADIWNSELPARVPAQKK
jgi:ketosteroid isomerase-like protein